MRCRNWHGQCALWQMTELDWMIILNFSKKSHSHLGKEARSSSSPKLRVSCWAPFFSSSLAFFRLRAPVNQSCSWSFSLSCSPAAPLTPFVVSCWDRLILGEEVATSLAGLDDGEGGTLEVSTATVSPDVFLVCSTSSSASSCLSPSQSDEGLLVRVEVGVAGVFGLDLRSGECELISSVENLVDWKQLLMVWHKGGGTIW